MSPEELKYQLTQFHGTEGYLRYNPVLCPKVLLTDGAKFLAEEAGAYWFMDLIASHLPSIPKEEHFVVAWLVKNNGGAKFFLQDDIPASVPAYAIQKIEYTDFPLDEITLYVARQEGHWIILLPSEY